MGKLLYLSDIPLNIKSGHGNMVNMHHEIVKSIFGDDVISVFAGNDITTHTGNMHFIKKSNSIEKAIAVVSGDAPYISMRLKKYVCNIVKNENINYMFVENSISGSLLKKIKKINDKIQIIAYFPDIEKQLMSEQLKNAKLYRKISLKTMIKNEGETVKYADKTFVLNQRDEDLYFRIYECKPAAILPVTVPIKENRYPKIHHANEALNILFVGVDYYPNVYGIEWFINEVIPNISIQYTLSVVGYNMEKYRNKWEVNKNIVVVGTVDDLQHYYEMCDIVIAPIFEGGGMKVKTAEALSYGKLVIGTYESTFGYWENAGKLRNKGIFRCSTGLEFADCINQLGNKQFDTVSPDIINYVSQFYSMNSNCRRLMQLFGMNTDTVAN